MQVFECHITVAKPTTKSQATWYQTLAETQGWKTSVIDGDPLLGQHEHFYFTTHSKTYEDIFIKMEKLASYLEREVLRKKIEHVVYDSGKKLLKGAS